MFSDVQKKLSVIKFAHCLPTMMMCPFMCVSEVCVDTDSAAARSSGATWLRLKGPKVEYCRCTSRGRVQCHEIPVKSE